MIEAKNLLFRYPRGNFGFSAPEFAVSAGESVALTGPSGCGKTTLLQLLAGVLIPDGGSVSVDGVTISTLGIEDRQDFRALYMGLIFQEFELLEYLNVIDNVILPYRVSPMLQIEDEVRQRSLDLINLVGLADKEKSYSRELSQGERQRVAVCRSLVTQPKVIFGDEPTANLDSENRDHVIDALMTHKDKWNVSLVVVTHDRELHSRFDRVVDIRDLIL